MPSIKLQDTGLPGCGEYYLTHRDSLELRSKMAMKTEWGVAFAIHNVALATTKFKVFIKISSNWIQKPIEVNGKNCISVMV